MVRTASFALLAVALLVGGAPVWGAPAVQLSEGTSLLSAQTPVSYGTADIAVRKTKTFTLRNTGDTALTIDPFLKLPQGFTVTRRPGVQTLAPGEVTTFAVSLNAARAGYFAGQIVVNTSAGAISLPVEGTALGRPSVRILDNADAGFRTVGRWTAQNGVGLHGNATAIPGGIGTNVAAWTFKGLTPGLYQVSASWTPGSHLATAARYTLVNGNKTAVVAVNQQLAPADFRDAGTAWQRLGQPFKINGNTLVVQLSDLANGAVLADAVRIERVGYAGQIVTAADPGFKTTGTWSATRGKVSAYQTSNGSASWTFTVRPGQYRVSANWTEGSQLSAQAHYTILDGGKALATVPVNQQVAPGHFRDAGFRWQDLSPQGGLYTIQSGQLTVTLSSGGTTSGPGGPPPRPIAAGAVRVEQFNGPTIQTQADVIRFLNQATWGASPELAAAVEEIGLDAYMSYQYNVATSGYATQPLYPQGVPQGCDNVCNLHNYTQYIPKLTFFYNGMYGEDQLKQRMAWALHKIIVAGATEQDTRQASRMIPYYQIIDNHTLGDFRSLLGQVTLNAAMGAYLDMKDSTRTRPNENYAREILQLFSIGLFMLNPDGTPQYNGTDLIPTYNQAIVDNYTKVFTGWNINGQVPAPPPYTGNVPNYHVPMVIANNTQAQNLHDWTQKVLLNGVTIPARTMTAQQTVANANAEMNTALNSIFNHTNVGPFICKGLIQQFVTSNPSPAYVERVVSYFDYNPFTGARGDLSGVLWAIIMDPEARDIPIDPNYGKLREPVQYALNLLRAFNAYSHDGTWYSDGYIEVQTTNMGQNVFYPPSVFSYFPPDNELTGYAGVLAPEFGIYDTAFSIRRANFLNQMTFGNGIAVTPNPPYQAFYGTSLTLQPVLDILDQGGAEAVADYLNDLILHGEMSTAMRNRLITAINTVPAANRVKKVRTAIYLVFTSSQYQVQR